MLPKPNEFRAGCKRSVWLPSRLREGLGVGQQRPHLDKTNQIG